MDDDIKQLLEKNLELTKKLEAKVNKINRYLFWQKVYGTVKVLIIVIPIVLGIIYLPQLIQTWIKPYQEQLQTASQSLNSLKTLNNTLQQLENRFKSIP